jgi:hypothetical protein
MKLGPVWIDHPAYAKPLALPSLTQAPRAATPPVRVWLPGFTAGLSAAVYSTLLSYAAKFNAMYSPAFRFTGVTMVLTPADVGVSAVLQLQSLMTTAAHNGMEMGVTLAGSTPADWAAFADLIRSVNATVSFNPVRTIWLDSENTNVPMATAAFSGMPVSFVVAGSVDACAPTAPNIRPAPELYDIDDTVAACTPSVPCAPPAPAPGPALTALFTQCLGLAKRTACLLTPGGPIPLLTLQCPGRKNVSGVTYTGTNSYYGSTPLVELLTAYRDAAVAAGWPSATAPIDVGLYEAAYVPAAWITAAPPAITWYF